MTKPFLYNVPDKRVGRYLERYGCDRRWNLVGNPPEGLDTVVVIPALAESAHLFRTLNSVATTDPISLATTLVICVINNKGPGKASESDRRDNERTLAILNRLVNGKVHRSDGPDASAVAASNIALGFIDASSSGRELPSGEGVGLARKIGMDRGIEVFDYCCESMKLLFCLDADTLVDPDWLSATRRQFQRQRLAAAAIEFAHQPGENADDDDAVILYETVIRYYRTGLSYAGSPYAFHAIGSTIAVSLDGYLAVRGMSRRQAGEDFYFLNKLAKAGRVGIVSDTRVYPSSRRSQRVPFGTGQVLSSQAAHGTTLGLTWSPEVFHLLKAWVSCLKDNAAFSVELRLEEARAIHPLFPEFLRREGFETVWPRLLANSGGRGVSLSQAAGWFDALKTYKFVRYMTENALSPIPLYQALNGIRAMQGRRIFPEIEKCVSLPGRETRRYILAVLRQEL